VSCKEDSLKVIDAANNWWGTADSTEIEALIWHNVDNYLCPTIDFMPCAIEAFDIDDSIPTVIDQFGPDPLPAAFSLDQNYPNPFNSATTISFELSRRTEVSLIVYNVLGQKMSSLVEGVLPAGSHEVDWDGHDVATGVYFYRLKTPETAIVRKMVLLK